MSMIHELNSELAVELIRRMKAGEDVDRQAMLTMLRQIQATLRPLSKADRQTKVFDHAAARKPEERAGSDGH